MLSLIKAKAKRDRGKSGVIVSSKGKKGKTKTKIITITSSEVDSIKKTDQNSMYQSNTEVLHRPSSAASGRPSSRGPSAERPSSRNSNSGSSRHSNQPRLGVGVISGAPAYLFEDDSGIMSEVETSSTARFKRSNKERSSLQQTNYVPVQPRTSPGGYSTAIPFLPDDDSGIMSEAETASTARKRSGPGGSSGGSSSAGRYSIPMGSLTLNRQGFLTNNHTGPTAAGQQPRRGVQFRQPVVQFSGVSSTLFEDDPGIMSEVETVSTSGRRRQQQQQKMAEKHALPIVRTPSKTLERPLGLVFLIYRGETKRALLPNEITSLDTVKALFVRSFGKQLTMEYMDTPRVKIYIHDSNKDIFYELENLSEIKDRTVLKLFEADSSGRGPCGLGPSGMPPITNAEDLTPLPPATPVASAGAKAVQPTPENEYVDSWHVKAMKALRRAEKESDLVGSAPVRGTSSTLPRPPTSGVSNDIGPRAGLLGERSKTLGPGFLRGHRFINGGVLPGQQGMGGRVESGYVSSPDGNFEFETSLGRVLPITGRFSTGLTEPKYYKGPESTEEAKERMMHMEAQLSQLTGMVEKALKNKKLGKKTVSFDKAVTYSDDSPPQPTSILTNSSKRQQQQAQQVQQTHHHLLHNHLIQPPIFHPPEESSLMMDPGLYNQLRGLQRSARDLRQEVKVLKRLTQLQSMAMKDLVQDTYLKLREACIAFAMSQSGSLSGNAFDLELWRVAQDEEIYQKELNELVRSISHLEAKVEETRSGVINKKNKIHLADVENMALILSKSSRTVTQLKRAFPTLEANLRSSTALQQQKGEKNIGSNTSLLVTEDFLKRTPERLDNVWRRCKKLTGTLVTLKRLASVQEQRIHPGLNVDVHHVSLSPTPSEMSRLPPANVGLNCEHGSQKESTLDDLLDALQNYSGSSAHHHHHHDVADSVTHSTASPMKKQNPVPVASSINTKKEISFEPSPIQEPATSTTNGHSESVNADVTIAPGKHQGPTLPPYPAERKNASLKGAPPPPPPRTSSNKTTQCETSDGLGQALAAEYSNVQSILPNVCQDSEDNQNQKKANSVTGPPVPNKPSDINSLTGKNRQDLLEVRHQELLMRQKQLQEQYQRLQQMQQKKSAATIVANSQVIPSANRGVTNQPLPHQPTPQVRSQQQQQLVNQSVPPNHPIQSDEQQSPPQQNPQQSVGNCSEENDSPRNSGEIDKEDEDQQCKDEDTSMDNDPSEVTALGEDFPFADSSLKDDNGNGDTSSDSAISSNDQKDDNEKPEEIASCMPKAAPPPPPPPSEPATQLTRNGKIPPEVPARKSKECTTKVYRSELI